MLRDLERLSGFEGNCSDHFCATERDGLRDLLDGAMEESQTELEALEAYVILGAAPETFAFARVALVSSNPADTAGMAVSRGSRWTTCRSCTSNWRITPRGPAMSAIWPVNPPTPNRRIAVWKRLEHRRGTCRRSRREHPLASRRNALCAAGICTHLAAWPSQRSYCDAPSGGLCLTSAGAGNKTCVCSYDRPCGVFR
jgi:hypothetical protein